MEYYKFLRDLCQGWATRVQVNTVLVRVVEVDESKLFHVKYNIGNTSVNASLRLGVWYVADRTTYQIADRTAYTLLPIIANNVAAGTTIVSNG